MQHSRSHGSFSSDSTAPILRNRPQSRSSMDTFLIPGRTRIPSNKPQSADYQIAEALLESNLALPRRNLPENMASKKDKKDTGPELLLNYLGIEDACTPTNYKGKSRADRNSQEVKSNSEKKREDSESTLQADAGDPSRSRFEVSKHHPPPMGGRDAIIIPNRRRSRKVGDNPPPKRAVPTPPPRKIVQPRKQQGIYDGAIGSSFESRTTSMTWSTVSHRIFSESSADALGMGASENLDEFNRLAVEHGLPELENCPGDDSHQSKELVEKNHQPNWLARKFFHRSTSTYHLKVKSTHKTLKHRKSFGVIPKLEPPGARNILLDKSIEEICRLGGTGTLALPEGFGVRKRYSLPTCLSATATYLLQHGANYPGLFRISGQSSNVSALYDFYAFQFVQAGSPSKVQETVGSGLLPTHIEHSVPDVASVFKKIVSSLPGGLLGSLELFDALRNIFFELAPGPDLSHDNKRHLQARLVALAISSVRSARRAALIQAVIGMAAYFAHEAEDTMKDEGANEMGNAQEIQQSSELMGYRALGVVMGPLMLGTMVDQLQLSPPAVLDSTPRRSIDSMKKGDKRSEKKQKRNSGTDKIGRDAELSAHVDRANVTAAVMERLLVIWKDVVLQLRAALEESGSLSSQDAKRRWGGNHQHMDSSDEGVLFMDMLKAGPPGTNFSGTFKMKAKVKVGKSPMSHSFRKASSDPFESQSALESSRELAGKTSNSRAGARIVNEDTDPLVQSSGSGSTESIEQPMLTSHDLQEDHRTKSDIAMDKMSMGTILPPPEESFITPIHKDTARSVSYQPTIEMRPRTPQIDDSSHETPETALRDITRQEIDSNNVLKKSDSILDKPLPPIGAAQHAETSPGKSNEENVIEEPSSNFPVRQSSLPQDKGKQRQLSSNSVQAQQTLNGSSPVMKPRSRSSMTPTRRKLSQYDMYQTNDGGSKDSKSSNRSRRGSVKLISQRYNTAPVSRLESEASVANIPKIFARIYPLPQTKNGIPDDPFTSSSETIPDNTSPKKTRIPKPAQDLGNVRKDSSPSSSPPKSPRQSPSTPTRGTPKQIVRKRTSIFSILPDSDAGTIRRNSIRSSTANGTIFHSVAEDEPKNPSTAIPEETVSQAIDVLNHEMASKEVVIPQAPQHLPPPPPSTSNDHERINSVIGLEVAPTRPLSAYSAESLRRIRLQEEPPVAQHVPTRVLSIEVNASDDPKITTSVTKHSFEGLERTGSINTAMSTEINRLRRLLEQKEKEVRETRRSLELSRDLKDDDTNADGSPRKGTLANELRMSRKEAAEWKRRAEWAESRLLIVGGETLESKAESSKGPSSRVATPRNGSAVVERPKNWFPE